MRQVVLDTETTGLSAAEGHRVIEIGAVEIVNRRTTDNTFHQYLNPERDIDVGALGVHGITLESLQDKPYFADIAEDLLAFVRDSELIIHNAPFDIGFLNAELVRLNHEVSDVASVCTVLDSLVLARKMHPGQNNKLDALCRRYDIDNSRREYHGALLDAELLADVYLAMTGGQVTLSLQTSGTQNATAALSPVLRAEQTPLRVIKASSQELEAHEVRLASIDEASNGQCVWKRADRLPID